ncbi:MAG: response regulator transcription factor [Verrucomicrobia bacterium]|nr:response regulator transcription factor [Verrucomicrobiota bacterium]
MLAEVLSHMPEFEVVGQADTLEDALRVARHTQPDVVILDWVFPGGGGEAFLREMKPNRLHARVLVLSGRTEEETVNSALMLGARGYFEKGGNLEEFMTALRTVVAGGAYFGPVAAAIVKRLLDAKPAPRAEKSEPAAPALAETH